MCEIIHLGGVLLATIEDQIASDALEPKEVEADGIVSKNHDLDQLIKADRYLASKKAAKKGFGIKRTKMVPPGAA